ncbi:AraC family transcriptional regulator [Tenacibaculum sp. 190524A05c]|uniref:helix-turn-helix transcriptional regulator n=1 Tax=Tenacibaculum platacis TaxID=3137852 RepID=UPI0032B17CBA
MYTIDIDISIDNKYVLDEILILKSINDHCGLETKEYTVKESFGSGFVKSWNFDGLMIRHREVLFSSDIKVRGEQKTNALIFSILLNGEKMISLPQSNIELIQEESESCISFINLANGCVVYPKGKLIREIVIKMSDAFIQKHQLDKDFPIYEDYDVSNLKNNFSNQLDYKTQQIVNELLEDNRNGLLKRLFLESKVLELLMLRFDSKNSGIKNSTTLKKVHLAKDFIINNLDVQISIQELSKKVFLNEFQLKKEFKSNFGTTIFDFALQQRMVEAKKLLSNTSKPIYEIAELVGYKNPTHFSAAFKKIVKQTPKQYRNTV